MKVTFVNIVVKKRVMEIWLTVPPKERGMICVEVIPSYIPPQPASKVTGKKVSKQQVEATWLLTLLPDCQKVWSCMRILPRAFKRVAAA